MKWWQRIMCGVGLHSFGKWSEKEVMKVTITHYGIGVSEDSQCYVQMRQCSVCGIEKARKVK